jgi:hypothetical protein
MVELSQGRNVQHAYTWLLMKPGMDRAKVGCVTDLILYSWGAYGTNALIYHRVSLANRIDRVHR